MSVVELTDKDYQAIEDAVMETARGRWFLSEYKKRNGVADTSTLLDAISRLEKVIGSIKTPTADDNEPVAVAIAPATVENTGAAPVDDGSALAAAQAVIVGDAAPHADEQPSLSNENLQFFANDEELFSSDANDILPETKVDAPVVESVGAEEPAVSITVMDPKPAEESTPEGNDDGERIQIFQSISDDQPAKVPDTRKEALPNVDLQAFDDSQKGNDASDLSASLAETVGEEPQKKPVPDISMQADPAEQERIVVIRETVDNVDIPLFDDEPDEKGTKANA